MQVHTAGARSDRDLLFLLGLGNRVRHPAVGWAVDELAADYRVHAVEIPDNGTDLDRDYLDPIERYAATLDDGYRLLAHSTGGLVAAHLPTDRPRVYCSPWWGLAPGRDALLGSALARVPLSAPVLPLSVDPDRLGVHAEAAARSTTWVSPAFLGMVQRAQAAVGPLRPDATVFCSLADRVVSVRAIGEHAPVDRIRLYDGAHEFFAAAGRRETLTEVRAALADPEWVTGSG